MQEEAKDGDTGWWVREKEKEGDQEGGRRAGRRASGEDVGEQGEVLGRWGIIFRTKAHMSLFFFAAAAAAAPIFAPRPPPALPRAAAGLRRAACLAFAAAAFALAFAFAIAVASRPRTETDRVRLSNSLEPELKTVQGGVSESHWGRVGSPEHGPGPTVVINIL